MRQVLRLLQVLLDADTAVDTIKEVIKLGQNYNTFLGKSDGKDNSVTFIYKTAELTK